MLAKERPTLRRLVIRDSRPIAPFNEEARELRILNKRLWLYQRDVLASYTREEREISSIDAMPYDRVETIVYRDNLFFDQAFIDHFLQQARRLGAACRVAVLPHDPAIKIHALPLQNGIRLEKAFGEEDLLVADLWYFPIPPASGGQQEDAGGKHGQTGFVHATRKPFNLTPMPCIPQVS